MKNNILITGGSGYIGKNLAEYFSTKYHLFIPTHRELDILETDKISWFVADNHIDYIIHAANVGGKRSKKNLSNVIGLNLKMFVNIIKQQSLVKRIIYFGSGAEFDKTRPIKNVKEEDLGKRIPINDYGFYKYVCSRLVENLTSKKIINLRLFGVYGKHEDYLIRFISNAIVKNLLLLPIDINQNVYFDYLYINDLVRITDYFIRHDSKYNIYNVASGLKIDLITIAAKINAISSHQSKIIIRKQGLNKEYTASNIRLTKEIAGFKFTSIEEGISDLYQWYRKRLDLIDRKKIISQIVAENA